MNKRVVIFMDAGIKTKEILNQMLMDYLKDYCNLSYEEIQIDYFNNLKESIDSGRKIGLLEDIFVIFDRRHYPKDKRKIRDDLTKEEQIYYDSLEHIFDLSKTICERNNLPYIVYKGQIDRGEEDSLKRDIELVLPKIKTRLETLFTEVL